MDPCLQSFHTDIEITSCILIIIFNNLSRHWCVCKYAAVWDANATVDFLKVLIYQKRLALNVFQWWFWRTWSFINTRWFLNTCLKESYLFSRSRSLRDEKLLNDGPFDTRKCSFFLVLIWLQVSNLTPDLWIVVADKTALVFGILMLVELCLNKSTVWPSMEYRHLFWLSFLSA